MDVAMHGRLLAGLIGLSLLFGGSVQAQSASEITIAAEATPSKVGTEETVSFTIRITGASLSEIEAPEPPSTSNLVLQEPTPTTERELSFDSGHLTRQITFMWKYTPLQVGIGRLQPTAVSIRDQRYTTDEIRVRIVPQSQRSLSRPSTRSPSPSSPRPSTTSRTALEPRDLFIHATASAETAYQNEQVTVEYRLFFRPGVRLRQSRMADAWDAPSFWREELDVASRPTPRPTKMYGQTYEAIVLKRVALFPTRAGTLQVDPLRIETEARAHPQRNQRSGPALSSRYEPVTLSSEQLSVVSKPLPSNPPPAFDGAVGTFTLDTSLDADSVEVGQAVELSAQIRGTGNLATVSPPTMNAPSSFETYTPSIRTDIDRSGEAVQGAKTFTYTLVPRSNGGYTLPPVTFSYFDPENEQYNTLRSEPMTLHATGDVPPRAASQTGQGLPIGKIAGPIENDGQWVETDRAPLYRQAWAYLALLVPVILAAGGVAYQQYIQVATGAPSPVPDGLDEAQHHLQNAHHHLREGEIRRFYQTVEHAVLTFLATRLDLSQTPSSMTREGVDHHLSRHDVPDTERDALHDLLDACDQAQFTPTEPSHDAMRATLDHAQTLLRRLDDALPPRSAARSA
jgi:hypothetical protein